MATEPFLGKWKVVDCLPLCGDTDDSAMLKGCEFELTKSGDVVWWPAEATCADAMPLFQCDTFEVLREREGFSVVTNLRFGAYLGHVLTFTVEKNKCDGPRDGMFLSYGGWCTLVCQPTASDRKTHKGATVASASASASAVDNAFIPKHPFHMLEALKEEFFADMQIVAKNGKVFPVHKLILSCALPDLDWDQTPAPLSGLDEDITAALLHFAYGQCLPEKATSATLQRCQEAVAGVAGFEKFAELTKENKKNSALCNKLLSLVNELHATANSMIVDFGGRAVRAEGPSATARNPEPLLHNAARLSHTLKQSLRNVAVGLIKLVHLGSLYATSRKDLSRDEQNEIISYAKTCLPIFLSQMHRFLSAVKNSSSPMMLPFRQELAAHFVPEIESLSETFNRIGFGLKDLLEEIVCADTEALRAAWSSAHATRTDGDSLAAHTERLRSGQGRSGKSLKHTLQQKDLMNLKKFHRYLSVFFAYLVQEKETFTELGPAGKIRTVAYQIEQLVDELPRFLLKLEEFTNVLNERLDFETFKFCFVAAATLLDNLLGKFRRHKDQLKPFLEHINALVQSESFYSSLVELGLLESQADPDELSSARDETVASALGDGFDPRFKLEPELHLCRKTTTPPSAESNALASGLAALLESRRGADMVAVVHRPASAEEAATDAEVLELPCHRVVLAARCPYFRVALLSGMRESIERRIEIHDTSAATFCAFLRFVYCGQVEVEDLSVDGLSELLLVADRFEMDSLKDVCECALNDLIEADTALTLFSIADHFNATKLRASCVEYIISHPDIAQLDTFKDLEEPLQNELEELLTWGDRAARKVFDSGADLSDMTAHLRISSNFVSLGGDEMECVPLTHDSSQLETCVSQLRDILGPLIGQDQLVRVALAADYDVNRAVHYFFNSERTDS